MILRLVLPMAAAAVALTACGPMPLSRAEDQCLRQAELAAGPRGEIGFGAASDGTTRGRFEVTVTSDYIFGRDPSAVYDACVFNKAGQPPSRPLYSRPDWKG